MTDRICYLNHTPIEAYFLPTSKDFVVKEIPLYEFSNTGEHLILHIRKKDLTTWDMIDIISSSIGCKKKDIGYAGLKDKNAMTLQYISIPKKFETKIQNIVHKKLKILNITYHNNKIRTGHLKGNSFFIRLKRINQANYTKIKNILKQININGIPNYFGNQRFGNNNDNYLKAIKIINSELIIKNKKEKEFLLNAYQSYLFNQWLSLRIKYSKLINEFNPNEISDIIGIDKYKLKIIKKQPHFFKIFEGELMHHYPYGKLFKLEDLNQEAKRFILKDIVPTGLLGGKKVKRASKDAGIFESKFDISNLHKDKIDSLLNGTRRFAWVYPTDINSIYKSKDNHVEINFSLPKGSYATILIEQLLNKIGLDL